jgi:hypothetical protein
MEAILTVVIQKSAFLFVVNAKEVATQTLIVVLALYAWLEVVMRLFLGVKALQKTQVITATKVQQM